MDGLDSGRKNWKRDARWLYTVSSHASCVRRVMEIPPHDLQAAQACAEAQRSGFVAACNQITADEEVVVDAGDEISSAAVELRGRIAAGIQERCCQYRPPTGAVQQRYWYSRVEFRLCVVCHQSRRISSE